MAPARGVHRQLVAVAPGAGLGGPISPRARGGAARHPATIVRAYQRLVDLGVLVVRRGEGTFVALKPRCSPARSGRVCSVKVHEKLASLTATIRREPEDAFTALEAGVR